MLQNVYKNEFSVVAASNICTSTLERAEYTDKVKTGNSQMILEDRKPGNTTSDFYATAVQYILERSLPPLSIFTKM